MPEPQVLPPEILQIVLQFVLNKDPSLPLPLPLKSENQGLRDLYACCLVNSTWLAQSRPLLYCKFRHKSDEDSFDDLWSFLRTIIEKPELGALVRHLDLRRVRFGSVPPEVNPRRQRSRRRDARNLGPAIAHAGFKNQAKAIHSRNDAPLIVTLLTSLPNISQLYLTTEYLHDNVHYSYGQSFLQHLEKSGALHRIRNVMLFDSTRSLIGSNIYQTRESKDRLMAGICTLYRQPSIRSLSLFTLNPCSLPDTSKLLYYTSNVTHLTITCSAQLYPSSETLQWTLAGNSGLRACLLQPIALVSLTLNIGYFVVGNLHVSFLRLISHHELWEMLQHHVQTLEYLDMYDKDCHPDRFRLDYPTEDAMGKLDEFHRLKTLRVQPHILVGGIKSLPKVSYRLRDALPTSLSSLTLYDLHPNALIGGIDLLMELLEILDQTSIADNLKYLVINATPKVFRRLHDESDGRLFTQLEALHMVCKDHGIVFDVKDSAQVPQGGVNLLNYSEAYDIESSL